TWLGDIVICARFESACLTHLLRFGGQDNDGHDWIPRPQGFANSITVFVGQHQIEQDTIRRPLGGRLEPFGTTSLGMYLKPLEFESIAQASHNVRLVLDDQDLLTLATTGMGLHAATLPARRKGNPQMERRPLTWATGNLDTTSVGFGNMAD